MRTLTLPLAAALALGSAVLLAPSPAGAAGTEFGNGCLASNAPPGATVIATGSAAGSAAAPVGGVITEARFTVPAAAPPVLPTVLKVVRSTGVANQYRVVAQSPVLNVPNSRSTQDVRLPVSAGDFLGLFGSTGTLICNTGNAGDVAGSVAGDSAVGSTATYLPATQSSIPVVVTVEPDVDNDGYGDVTQDLCPQSAAAQVACPTIKLDSLATAANGSITVVVATSSTATVTVGGLVKVNGKKVKLKGGKKTVQPGSLTSFKVKLPAELKRALAKLPASHRITVTLTASATNAAGQVTTDKAKVRLPGTR
jgi:hypothetical protein